MDIIFGRVTGSSSEPVRDAEGNKRVLQVEVTDERDVRPVEWIDQPNQDAPPAENDQVLVVETGGSFDIAIAADDQTEKTAEGGEYEAYSRVINLKQTRIYLKKDGTVTIVSQPGGETPVATISMTPAGVVTISAQQIALAPAPGGVVELAGSDKRAAGEGDEIIIDGTTHSDFFAWAAMVTAFTSATPPLDPLQGIKGKINEGSNKVKLS